MDLPDFRNFEPVRHAPGNAVARRVDVAIERQKAEREVDLLIPALGGSVALLAAAWIAGAFQAMLVVVALRLVSDCVAQRTARSILANLAVGRDIARLKDRGRMIALFTGLGWGMAAWPIQGHIFLNYGALLIYITLHITAIMVAVMTAPSPGPFKFWIAAWFGAMVAPLLFDVTVTSLLVAVNSAVFAGVLLWISQVLHAQILRTFTLQIENEDLAGELGAVNQALARSLALAERNARHDSLTGLANRRAFEEAVVTLHSDGAGAGQHLLLIDLDHFKQVNDRFGHSSGDTVLAAASRCLARQMRDGECCARWGGEEFVALLLQCDRAAASARAPKPCADRSGRW